MLGPASTTAHRQNAGFTLVEMLIVVILLAILSTIALPQIRSQRTETAISTLKSNVTQVSMVLEYQKQKGCGKHYPDAIDPSWFVSGMLPSHPDQMAGVPLIETVKLAGVKQPRSKLVEPGCPGAYWYNATEGIFRARVKTQGSDAETLDFYNQVNQTSLVSLGDIGDSGGAGGAGGGTGR